LYRGSVVHTRLKPVRHRLRYRVFYLLLDIDDPEADLTLLSHNRFNLFSFHDRDHGGGDRRTLRHWVEREIEKLGMAAPASIRLLTLPRVLGYVFNPISVYFCYDAAGNLVAVIYEVNNTFGERHSYVARATGGTHLDHECFKRFYVSPFNDISGGYRIVLDATQKTISLSVHQRDCEGPLLYAGLNLSHEPLTDWTLFKVFLAMPLMTVKVIAAIHWEAFKLWRKGLKPTSRPAPPEPAITLMTDNR